MHEIDSENASEDRQWVAGDPKTKTMPTSGTAAWFNAVQNELVNVITSQGIDLDKNDNTQLLTAITELVISKTPAQDDADSFPESAWGTNWEDVHRALYKISASGGTQIRYLDRPTYDGLGYSGSTYTIDDKEYQHIELLKGSLREDEDASLTASAGLNASVSMQIGGIVVPFPSRRGMHYPENLTASGIIRPVQGLSLNEMAEQSKVGGLVGFDSTAAYFRADIILSSNISIHIDFDATGVHMFIHRPDGNYEAGCVVYRAAITVTQ